MRFDTLPTVVAGEAIEESWGNQVKDNFDSMAWDDWSPSYTNLDEGNGIVVARYVQIDKTVHFVYQLTFGSSTDVDGAVLIGLPVTAAGVLSANDAIIGHCLFEDANGTQHVGVNRYAGTTNMRPSALSGATPLSLSPTVPFTWAAGDILFAGGTYEAA